MRVTKMHGLGNDYIYVRPDAEMDWPEVTRRVSDRHFGVGSDGLIIGLDRFGASAPDHVLAEQLGFTPGAIADRVRAHLSR